MARGEDCEATTARATLFTQIPRIAYTEAGRVRIRLIPNDVITLCLLGDSNIFEYCDQWRLVVNSHCSPFEMSKARQKPIW